MAVTDYDFLLTRNELIEQVYRKIGVLPHGESMTAEQLDDGVKRLNLIVKSWQADNVFLWQEFTTTQALTPGTASYTLPTDPAAYSVVRAYYRSGTPDSDVELRYVKWAEYQLISDKDSDGTPVVYSVDTKNNSIVLYPVPTVADDLLLFCAEMQKDFDIPTDTGDFPAKWQRPIFYTLAADLAEDYPSTGVNQPRLEKKAGQLYAIARGSEIDTSDVEHVKGAY